MKLLKKIFNLIDIKQCKKNYSKKVLELKNKIKTKPIKVAFLVRENQKWTYQSLYELLEKDENFEPVVLISLLWLSHIGKDKTRNNLEENYNFFKSRNMNVQYAYKDGKYVNLKEFSPDIVFYDQPWDLPKIHQVQEVSKFALTCYSSYSYEVLDCKEDYTCNFHALLFKFFIEHDLNLKRYQDYGAETQNCVVAGYPKLDNYFNNDVKRNLWKEENKFKIIYAPHHSIDKRSIKLATFRDTGIFILEMAKENPQTTWIFRPHPRLKHRLLKSGIMSKQEVENYYNEWSRIGAISQEGDYIDLFKTSDLMITDCCSFLAEYLPSCKPLIRLVNKEAIPLNKLGEEICSGYYSVYNNEGLKIIFDKILFQQNDCNKEMRQKNATLIIGKEQSCKNIYNVLMSLLNGGNR